MDKEEEATKIISEKIEQAYALLRECEEISIQANVSFGFYPAYGMGGWFYPSPTDWQSAGWNSSSSDC